MKMSSATKRAMERNYYQSCEWFCDFKESDIEGIGYEEGVHRRDPSSVLKIGDLYYVWYSKSYGKHVGFHSGDENAKVFPWDYCDIWYATSEDGYRWEEKGIAVARGEKGSYDDRSVFTPEVLAYDGKYYLVYQVVQHPYVNRSFEDIAIAVSDSPEGPFVKSKEPILRPTKDGIWDGEEDNRFAVKKKGSFDIKYMTQACFLLKENSTCIIRANLWEKSFTWEEEKPNGALQSQMIFWGRTFEVNTIR